MKFAIIAAGEGSRLQHEGISQPKPLVPICGEPMIDRLIRIFRANGAEEIVIIVNSLNPQTEEHVRRLQRGTDGCDLRLIVKNTPSSMHSFYELSPYLQDSSFCLTTVDTIFREDEFASYLKHFREGSSDGCMAVTDYVDDESPLYVATDGAGRITGFHDKCEDDIYVSGGIYGLRPSALEVLRECIASGMSRMRNFQRALVSHGLQLEAVPFSKIMDVDHAGDIVKAERFVQHLD